MNYIKNIVVIGASAGGLDPLQKILNALPTELEDTAIVIAQHTSPNFESMLVSLLTKKTLLQVFEAENGMKLSANHIYTCPADTDVRVKRGAFSFSRPEESGPKPSADKLFASAAIAYKENVIGIIVSGTGNDGSLGVVEIKNRGGFVIAQDPETATYSGMPDSAILTEYVDMVLSPEMIGREIPKLLDKNYRDIIISEQKDIDPTGEIASVKKILELLHQKTGTDFSGYKPSTIHRRLEKRIYDKNYKNIEAYIADVESNPEELNNLFLYLLIGVTQFFRNPESIEVLKQRLKISLLEHGKSAAFRVWVPGCATGEEAYTIAMIIDNLIENGSPAPKQIQIFATDIDQIPLNKGRLGRYSESAFSTMPDHYKETYFKQVKNEYEVSPLLKKVVLFSKHDLTTNPPFLRLNVVSCRNLLIYFKTSLQNQILPLFHYTLEPNGLLFLGKSETVGRFKNLFETIDIKNKLYKRRIAKAEISHIPLLQPVIRPSQQTKGKNILKEDMTVSEMVKETFYKGYEYPYIVVDNSLTIVEINKDVSSYLTFPSGQPNFNALKLIHKEFRLDLRTLIGKANSNLGIIKGNYKKIEVGVDTKMVRLKVQPTLYSKPSSPFFIVSFEHSEKKIKKGEAKKSDIVDDHAELVVELEHELSATKEHLSTMVEELETSNEELQSLNEEMQSSNEELQASNEELETSNEELQATNEELNIAYNELRTATNKIEEQNERIITSQNDQKSLLDNSQQAFILISRDFHVLLFNNYAFDLFKEIFNIRLTEEAIYVEVLPAELLVEFHENFKLALKGRQMSFEQTVDDFKGNIRYLNFNFTPVESNDNKRINKVSISFIDITDKKKYESKLLRSRTLAKQESELWKSVFDNSPELLAIFSGRDYVISYANSSYKKLFAGKKVVGKKLLNVAPELKEQGFISLMDQVRGSGESIVKEEIPATLDYDGTGFYTRYFNFTYKTISEQEEDLPSIIVHAIDVTQQVEKREEIAYEEKLMRFISESIPGSLMVILPNREIEFFNSSAEKFFQPQVLDNLDTVESRIHKEDLSKFRKALKTSFDKEKSFKIETRLKIKDDRFSWQLIHGSPMKNISGELTKIVVTAFGIDEEKASQKKKDEFMGVASHELKTPLTSVKAYTQLLQEHVKGSEDPLVKNYLKKAASSILKLEKFVSDLLDVSRIQSGKLTLKKSEFSISQLLRDAVSNIQLTTKSHQLILEEGVKEIFVEADDARIEQVIVNLINNAIKYSMGQTEVMVKITDRLDEVEISVQDFGMGIEKGEIKNIFNKYYRIAQNSTKVDGLGIGLNISHEIIQMHKGDIWVESALNKGSIFYFTLPLKEKKDEKNTIM